MEPAEPALVFASIADDIASAWIPEYASVRTSESRPMLEEGRQTLFGPADVSGSHVVCPGALQRLSRANCTPPSETDGTPVESQSSKALPSVRQGPVVSWMASRFPLRWLVCCEGQFGPLRLMKPEDP